MYYNLLRKIAADLINASSFLVPKASLKIRSVTHSEHTCVHVAGSEGMMMAKPGWAPPASAEGQVPCRPCTGKGRMMASSPDCLLSSVLYDAWVSNVIPRLTVRSSGHLSGPAHGSQLCSRSCPGGCSLRVIGLSGHRCLSEAPRPGAVDSGRPGCCSDLDQAASSL